MTSDGATESEEGRQPVRESTSSNATLGQSRLYVQEPVGEYRVARREEVVRAATRILSRQLRRGRSLRTPDVIGEYLRMRIGALEHEVFSAAFLDGAGRLIAFRVLFRGTLRHISIYPREVVKEALRLNAWGVVLAHNHPSGLAEPSDADRSMHRSIASVLASVDVEVVDHLVVTAARVVSLLGPDHG